ncbi:uncharacterized protein LOC120346562 [Styela clava]
MNHKQNKTQSHGLKPTIYDSPSPTSRPVTRSSSSAKWELGWEDPDALLKISVFNESHVQRPKGASQILRNRISRMEQLSLHGKKRNRSFSVSFKPQEYLSLFRKFAKSVILLLKCFRMRRKFAVQSRNMTLKHTEQTGDFNVFKTSSINRELQIILSTPPEHRTIENLRKIQYYMKATGAHRLLASASTNEDLQNLARYVAYERYENDRVVAQQGRPPDRFYFLITGKLLIVKEYQIDTGIISKTVGVLTKGMTTNVEEMEKRNLRKSSLICRGPVETLVLDCDNYFLIHGERGGAPREFLSRHSLFRTFPFETVKCHKQLLKLQYFPKGAIIFGGGSEFEWIYIIKSGECSLIRVQTVADFKKKYPASSINNSEFGNRRRRSKSAAEKLADFRAWKGPIRSPLSFRQTRPHNNEEQGRQMELHKARSTGIPLFSNSSNQDENKGLKFNQEQNNKTFSTESEGFYRPKTVGDELNSSDYTSVGRVKLIPILGKSKFTSSQTYARKEKAQSASPRYRQAYLELGKLKYGDVLGFENTFQIEDLPNIRLMSESGAEVVLFNRNFFLRNAPTSLLSLISYRTSSYPDTRKARSDLETIEAWSMYKATLVRALSGNSSSGADVLSNRVLQRKYVSQPTTRGNIFLQKSQAHRIPPGTSDGIRFPKFRNSFSSSVHNNLSITRGTRITT